MRPPVDADLFPVASRRVLSQIRSVILTLASRSPRRREMLEQLGLDLAVRPADTDESVLPGEAPRDYVRRVAREKALAVDGNLVLAADTAVVLAGEVLGKPRDRDDARRMLAALSGHTHEVLSGVCARTSAAEESVEVRSEVTFAHLTERQISWYVATGEPMDKAGAYAIQGVAAGFVSEVRGSVSNVIGLPLLETLALLGRLGLILPWEGEVRT
jgi:septum formation protein